MQLKAVLKDRSNVHVVVNGCEFAEQYFCSYSKSLLLFAEE